MTICKHCGHTMTHEGKFMRNMDIKYVVHIYNCSHCGMKQQIKENIEKQPMRNNMLCDGCNQELDSLGRCKNIDCSECWWF